MSASSWERLTVLLRHTSARKVSFKRRHEGTRSFLPGEIVNLPLNAGLYHTYLNFLRSNNIKPTQVEIDAANISMFKPSRFGLILEHLSDKKLLVLPIASYDGVMNGAHIPSPLFKRLSVALGSTSNWPTSVPAIRTYPQWQGPAYLLTLPLATDTVERSWHRGLLISGELERVAGLVKANLQAFSDDADDWRRDESYYIEQWFSKTKNAAERVVMRRFLRSRMGGGAKDSVEVREELDDQVLDLDESSLKSEVKNRGLDNLPPKVRTSQNKFWPKYLNDRRIVNHIQWTHKKAEDDIFHSAPALNERYIDLPTAVIKQQKLLEILNSCTRTREDREEEHNGLR